MWPEAAACGGVSLAAACGGLREALVDGITGFLLPSGDAVAWRARIADWSPETRTDFVTRSMQETHRRYAWERVAAETVAAYRAAGKSPQWVRSDG